MGWKPDYTGYHNTVNIKLHRMRYETSQVVGNIIEKYNIGPTGRIVLQPPPDFLYPRQQRAQKGTPGSPATPTSRTRAALTPRSGTPTSVGISTRSTISRPLLRPGADWFFPAPNREELPAGDWSFGLRSKSLKSISR